MYLASVVCDLFNYLETSCQVNREPRSSCVRLANCCLPVLTLGTNIPIAYIGALGVCWLLRQRDTVEYPAVCVIVEGNVTRLKTV